MKATTYQASAAVADRAAADQDDRQGGPMHDPTRLPFRHTTISARTNMHHKASTVYLSCAAVADCGATD